MTTKPTNPKDIVGIRKAPMSTVSAAVMAEVGVAMLEGACKYGRHNYRAVGVRASVYYDATMRHMMDWWEGVDVDPDSGMHHITKAITSLVVLRDAMIQDKCCDDRPPRSVNFYDELNRKAGEIMDKYADRNPKHYTIADDILAESRSAGGYIPSGKTYIVGEQPNIEPASAMQDDSERMAVIGQNGEMASEVYAAVDGAPSWADAPEWAMWLACGDVWFWSENKPAWDGREWSCQGGRFLNRLDCNKVNIFGIPSLRFRPEKDAAQ